VEQLELKNKAEDVPTLVFDIFKRWRRENYTISLRTLQTAIKESGVTIGWQKVPRSVLGKFFFVSSPEHDVLLWWPIVHRPCVRLYVNNFFKHFLWNHSLDFNRTSQERPQGGSHTKVVQTVQVGCISRSWGQEIGTPASFDVENVYYIQAFQVNDPLFLYARLKNGIYYGNICGGRAASTGFPLSKSKSFHQVFIKLVEYVGVHNVSTNFYN